MTSLPGLTARELNERAESTVRVQCSQGHWTGARARLTQDRRDLELVPGQTCRVCKEVLK